MGPHSYRKSVHFFKDQGLSAPTARKRIERATGGPNGCVYWVGSTIRISLSPKSDSATCRTGGAGVDAASIGHGTRTKSHRIFEMREHSPPDSRSKF